MNKRILIMHQTITKHDAVGNDIELMTQTIQKAWPDTQCFAYAENRLNPALTYIEKDEALALTTERDSLIIYHHSNFWQTGEEILSSSTCQLLICYHNITPPHFFEPYCAQYTANCKQGRMQTERLAKALPKAIWACASRYNAEDLTGIIPQDRIFVRPPFHKIETWANSAPDSSVFEAINADKRLQLFFVGRVAPNKGHLFLIQALQYYVQNFDDRIVLRVAGKFDDAVSGYNQLIRQSIQSAGLSANVVFDGEISDAILTAYYSASDLFVCASEHEGFCVPVLEAQYFGLPIVSVRSSAIPETAGPSQVLLPRNPQLFAAALHVLGKNKENRTYLAEVGKRNYQERFHLKTLQGIFLSVLSKMEAFSQ